MGVPQTKGVEIRKVPLGPVKCYFEAKDFLGDQYWLFLGVCFVSMLIGGAVPVVVLGPAYAGMVLCMLKRARGEKVTFETMFKGFDYFMPSLIATLVYVGAAMILAIPFLVLMVTGMIIGGANDGQLFLVGGALFVASMVYWITVVSLLIMVYMFGICLVVDKKMDGWSAMKTAAKGVWLNMRGVAGTSFVGQLAYFIGAMMCFFPGLLLMPIIFTGHFIAYWKIFGINTSDAVVAEVV